MLNQPAIPRVITSLTRFAQGLDADLATFADLAGRLVGQATPQVT
jgi:hypothetical protein